jgi:hypothetical protein
MMESDPIMESDPMKDWEASVNRIAIAGKGIAACEEG